MICDERAAAGRQCPFQVVQKLAQIRSRLRFARSRPQQERQPLPRLWGINMQNQIREQRLETVRVDCRKRLSLDADPQVSEQVDPHDC
jgi:hypothetical protein